MPQLPRTVIKARAEALRVKGAAKLKTYLARQVGRETVLLMEQPGFGRMPGFAPARTAISAEPGTLLHARLTGYTDTCLIAEPIA